MCSHCAWFSHFTPLSRHMKVVLGNNSAIPAVGSGCLNVKMLANGKWINSILQDILYVPDLYGNLLSISHLTLCGTEVCFLSKACQVFDQCKSLILEGGLHNNLYVMNMQVTDYVTANVAQLSPQLMDTNWPLEHALTTCLTTSSAPIKLWHCRLGHLNFNAIIRMVDKGLVTGMTVLNRQTPSSPYKPCLEGKQTCKVICKITMMRAKHVLGCVHTDVCSPLPVHSHRSYRYFITFINNSSHFASVSPLREKSEVGKSIKSFITWVELETGQRVKILHSDRGGEYLAGYVKDYLEECGIKHKVTTPNTPQHNGVAEHLNRMLLDKAQAMLADANLPKSYWLEAINYATLLHNLSPSRSISMTPSELYTGTKPDVSQLCVFGCTAHTHVPEKSHDKLSAHSLSCTFLGFSQQQTAFRLMHRLLHKFIESYDIIFNEGGPHNTQEQIVLEPNADSIPPPSLPSSPAPTLPPSPTSRPKCITRPPIPDDNPRYNISSYSHHANVANADIPKLKTYDEAMASPDTTEWLATCDDKMWTWKHLDVYDIIPRPKGQKIIGSKWVFHVK
jgi:hypothetical protein